MNNRAKEFIAVLIIQLVLTLPFMAADAFGFAISNTKVTQVTSNSATVQWATDNQATSELNYGKIKSLGINQKDNNPVQSHAIVANNLEQNTTYFFSVKSANSSGDALTDDNSGRLYNFTTLGSQQSLPSPSPFNNTPESGPPSIDAALPRFFNKKLIDIAGTTRAFSSVSLFVNDMNAPKKSLSGRETSSSGKFAFTQVQLAQENLIKIAVVDQSGNKNEKLFQVSVDTEAPVVKISNITSLTSKVDLNITGIVSKPVVIKVFVDSSQNAPAVPEKITGVKPSKIGPNSIELKWDESKDKDFSHYAIYRDDAGPIATTNPASFNLYVDALVDSGKDYTYQISSINIFGNEGPKSDPVTVRTSSGGAVLGIKPSSVDIFEESRKPLMEINVTNNFNFGVRLDRGDSTYNLKFVFEDKFSNRAIVQQSVTLDTKKPHITITSPQPGAFIYENVANNIDITGKTKPNARVHLYVGRTPISSEAPVVQTSLPNEFPTTNPNDFVQTILPGQLPETAQSRLEREIADLPSKIENISEKELDATCHFISAARSSCRGADQSVTADSEGNFRFEKVDLIAAVSSGAGVSEVPVSEFRDTFLNRDANQPKRATIVLIATDQLGQRGFGKETLGIGTCWSGNQSWEVIPITQKQSPTLLSTERLAEGTQSLYFFFNYSYVGRGTNAHIRNVYLTKACGTRDSSNPRYNISCTIAPEGNAPTKLNPEGTLTYSAVQLGRLPNMDRFLEADWKSFLNALGVNREFTFPFKVLITYTHDVINDNGQVQTMTETQTTCQEVSYVVDNYVLNPLQKLPDWLLKDFVDGLQKSIAILTDVQEKIDKVINYVAIGCLYSFFAHLAFTVYRNWIDLSSEKIFILQKGAGLTFNTGSAENDQYCNDLAVAIQKANGFSGIGDLKLKYYSDSDLKKCFPASYNAWQREANSYQWQRWSCDRLFGHSAPSKWTETKSDDSLQAVVATQKPCDSDVPVHGMPINAEDCRSLIARSAFAGIRESAYNPGDKCFSIAIDGKSRRLYKLGNQVEGSLYQLEYIDTSPAVISIGYAIKVTENRFITAQPKTCEEICGGVQQQTSGTTGTIHKGGDSYVAWKSGEFTPQNKNSVSAVFDACVTVSQCNEWRVASTANTEGKKLPDGTSLKDYTVESKGYTQRCFYDGTESTAVVSNDPNTRKECCCIKGKLTANKDTFYYQPNDKDEKLNANALIIQKYSDRNPLVHQSKKDPNQGPQPPNYDPKAEDIESYADMKWSYRYSKIGYLSKTYNPNRYTDGRDKMACFGQNNLFYQIFHKEKELVEVNPFKQDTAVLQCVFLTGVSQRLQMFKNIMAAMSNCLIEVRRTGTADTAVCKELFTQHVCGLISQMISFFVGGCTPESSPSTASARELGIAEKVKLGMKGISKGINEAQQEISQEYQNARLNNLLGIGEGGVARKVCLGAFGYDWGFTAKNLVDVAYTAPFATLVQPITQTREFDTIDPQTLRSRYYYSASWLINPGCEFDNYKVELACVSRKEMDQYPDQVNCGAVGAPSILYTGQAPFTGSSTGFNQCDCINSANGEKTYLIFNQNLLRQNALVEKSFHRLIDDIYRYDHIKFTLIPDRRIPANIRQNCFPPGHENGVFYRPITDKTTRDILDCSADPLSGVFSCSGGSGFFSGNGIVQLNELTINDQNPDKLTNNNMLQFKVGDDLNVKARVTKTGKDKCFKVSISPDFIRPSYEGIELNGSSDVGPIRVTPSLTISGSRNIQASSDLTIVPIGQNNQAPVRINYKFVDTPLKGDNSNKDGVHVYSIDDAVEIDNLEINLEQPTVGKKQDDTRDISFEGNEFVVRQNSEIFERIKLEGKVITIEKQGATIQITDVKYIPTQPTQAQSEIYNLQGVIVVNTPQQSPQASQQKTIVVQIFNIRGDRGSYENNPDNCNENEKVIEKTYRFTVTEKGVDSNSYNPVIQRINVNPSATELGKGIVLSTRITHKSGIVNNKVEVTITGPDGTVIYEPGKYFMGYADENTGYTFNINTGTGSDFTQEGEYSGNIKAVSKAILTDGTSPESKLAFKFNLRQPK